MVNYLKDSGKRIKVQIAGPTTVYTYNLVPEDWEAFPLSDGNGSYQISVYQNTTRTKYAKVLSAQITVQLENEFIPFLYSNQYVDFEAAPATVQKARELIGYETDVIKKVEKVYDFVTMSLVYDTEKAATVQSGYLPALDSVLAEKKGICFDYAALMAGMLRSQGVPCKLVVGYADAIYHAWISVWSEHDGWIDGAIYFDGKSWERMDPTFASGSDETMLSYIQDNSHYKEKYLY